MRFLTMCLSYALHISSRIIITNFFDVVSLCSAKLNPPTTPNQPNIRVEKMGEVETK